MNISTDFTDSAECLSSIFDLLGQPSRLQIVLAIGNGEALVCQLCATLNHRQAYISQQLMELRKGGLVTTRRQGRFIYYRLAQPQLLDLIGEIAKIMDVSMINIELPPISECKQYFYSP